MVISRFTKMAIYWYVVARMKWRVSEELAKAYGYWKAVFYAVSKQRGFIRSGEKKEKHEVQIGKKDHWIDILKTPFGDNIEIEYKPDEIVLLFGKKKKQKITSDDYDRKIIAKFPDRKFYNSYVMYIEYLIGDKPVRYFKSRWYKDMWVKIRDKEWDKQLALLWKEAVGD